MRGGHPAPACPGCYRVPCSQHAPSGSQGRFSQAKISKTLLAPVGGECRRSALSRMVSAPIHITAQLAEPHSPALTDAGCPLAIVGIESSRQGASAEIATRDSQ